MRSTRKTRTKPKQDRRRRQAVRHVNKGSSSTKDIGDFGEDLVAGVCARYGKVCMFTKGSGRVHGDGDMKMDQYSFEVKTGKSISVSYDKWCKVVHQAQRATGIPAMPLVLMKDKEEPIILVVLTIEQFLTLLFQ